MGQSPEAHSCFEYEYDHDARLLPLHLFPVILLPACRLIVPLCALPGLGVTGISFAARHLFSRKSSRHAAKPATSPQHISFVPWCLRVNPSHPAPQKRRELCAVA